MWSKWSQKNYQSLECLFRYFFYSCKLIYEYHHLSYCSIESKSRTYIFIYFFDCLMQCHQYFFVIFIIFIYFWPQITNSIQKLFYSFYSVCIPAYSLIKRSHKHLINSQCICSVFIYDIIWIYYISSSLWHFTTIFCHNQSNWLITLKWFLYWCDSHIVQKHISKSCINHVSIYVFSSSNIHIYWMPKLFFFWSNKLLVIMRIHISDPIPAWSSPSWHSIWFSLCISTTVWTFYIHPFMDICQWSFFCTCWLIIFYVWQSQR